MNKKVFIIVFISMVVFLTSCEQGNYTKTEHTLNGHDVYIYDSQQEICAAWYSMGIELDEETTYHIINLCPKSYVVLVDEEYVSLINFIRDNEVSREELEELGYGYFSIETSIENVLDIDLNEFSLESIIVKELDNEIMDPPEWDTFEEIDLIASDVMADVALILAEPLGELSVCDGGVCMMYYPPGPINITFVNGDTTIVLEVYENYLNILKKVNDEFHSIIYNVRNPSENVSNLYEIIVTQYHEINE